jgi:fucose permease
VFAVAFVVLGLPDFGHGVAWPDMRAELHRPLADLGVFLSVQALGYLAVAMTTGRLAVRWEIEGLVLRSTLTSAVGLALVAAAPAWPLVLVGGFLSGAGAGGMDTGFNAAVALRHDGRLMGLLHAGYGLGAAIGPVVVGASLVAGGGWRPPYALFALASLALAVALFGRTLGDMPEQESMGMGSLRGVVLPCLTFLIYVSLEVTVGQWAFTYLTEARGVGELAASVWVGVYWVGLTAGRLWLGLTGYQRPSDRLLTASVVGAAAGALLLWFGGPVAAVGLPITGLALSVVFPLLMLLTPERVGPERAAAAVGWQTASSSVGAAVGPAVAGAIMESVGVDTYGPIALGMAGMLGFAIAAMRRVPHRGALPPPPPTVPV